MTRPPVDIDTPSDRGTVQTGLPKERAFRTHLLWNYLSFAVVGGCGFLIQFMIAAFMDAAALGVFNQVYACFVVMSQLAVAGVHHSVLKSVAEYPDESSEWTDAAVSGILLAGILGFLVAAAALSASSLAGAAMDSAEVGIALSWAAPGLLFLAINKVCMAVLNGRRMMIAFAAMQAIRPLLLLGFVATACFLKWPVALLGAAFTFSEVTLCVVLIAYVLWRLPTHSARNIKHWLRAHASFGFRGALSGLLMEVNVRVDVLILGLFVSDAKVGLYSFAAVFMEGLFNLLQVVRTNMNPILVRLVMEKRIGDLHNIVKRTHRRVYPATTALVLALLGVYPLIVNSLLRNAEFMKSWPILAILMFGVVIYSGFVPFDFLLLVGGKPGSHTLLMLVEVGTNVCLCFVFVRLWGIWGAAAAMSASAALGALYLNMIVNWRLRFPLLPALR
ncbi:oligosaccharide flippase family protein [Candidatus Poribacteria bacterium]|nr:oligosaccharide flippase family protein [Candidatus Poribacteria bacterium]